MRYELESNEANIVFLGKFNPVIFQPRWLEKEGIIGGDEANRLEAEEGALEFLHQDLAILNLNIGRLQVDRNRFSFSSTMEPLEAISDFALSCFRVLDSTPMHSLGINRKVTYSLENEVEWHRVGDVLAPKTPWGEILEQGSDRVGGLRAIVMEQSVEDDGVKKRLDGYRGHTQIKILPTYDILFGIRIEVDNHFEIANKENVVGCTEVVDILEKSWEKSIVESDKIIAAMQQV